MKVSPFLLALCCVISLLLAGVVLTGRVTSSKQVASATSGASKPSRSRARTMSRSAGRESAESQKAESQKSGESSPASTSLADLLLPSQRAKDSADVRTLASQPQQSGGQPEVVPMVGPVSQDKDLRDLPEIPQLESKAEQRLIRHPPLPNPNGATNDPIREVSTSIAGVTMPTPLATFAGITSAQRGCGCFPPDTDGDVGPYDY